MTRPLRIEFKGAVYHITSRGNARQAIFLTGEDFTDFLTVLCSVVRRYHFILHTYCLMNNHYHLPIETPEGNLSKGMRQLNGLYAQRFNQRHQKVGHLLQGRYKAILVDKDNYLLELCRYVVLNPVRANIVKDPKDWKWSSYQAAIGQEHFTDEIERLIRGKEKLKEIPKKQRYVTRPTLNEILKYQDKKSKNQAIYLAHLQHGYTLKDIAEYIGVHYTTVSRVIKKIEREDEK